MRSILLTSALFVACNGGLSGRSNPSRGDGLGVGDACVSSSQCGAGLSCENGACAVKLDGDDGKCPGCEDARDGGDDDDRLDGGENEQEHAKDGGEDGEHAKDGGDDDDDDGADGGEGPHGHHDDGGED